MRIMVLTNSIRTHSGYARVAGGLLPELAKFGHDIAMTGMQTSYSNEQYKGINIYPIMNDFHEANNINAQMHRLLLNIDHHKSDILLCHFQGDSFYNAFTQVFKPTVWYCVVEGEIIYKNPPLIRDTKKVKQVVAQTKAGQRELAKKGVKSEMIYHGFDPLVFKKGYDKSLEEEVVVYYPIKKSEHRMSIQEIPNLKEMMGKEFVIGFVGQNFGVRKHPELLLEAFSIFAKDKSDVMMHMHTLPRHPGGFDLLELAEYFDISDKILFSYGDYISSGWSDNALNVFYNSIDIFASATGAEGFGLAHLECMPAGVPQVVPDYPPMDEFCGNDERGLRAAGRGRIFPAGERRFEVYPEDLAAKMQILYDDKKLRQKMGKNAQEWSRQFSWDKIAKKFDILLRKQV
jgi:glycosyltransferase involved in cell wall biosynthesis